MDARYLSLEEQQQEFCVCGAPDSAAVAEEGSVQEAFFRAGEGACACESESEYLRELDLALRRLVARNRREFSLLIF